jgi:hypothetical protein
MIYYSLLKIYIFTLILLYFIRRPLYSVNFIKFIYTYSLFSGGGVLFRFYIRDGVYKK